VVERVDIEPVDGRWRPTPYVALLAALATMAAAAVAVVCGFPTVWTLVAGTLVSVKWPAVSVVVRTSGSPDSTLSQRSHASPVGSAALDGRGPAPPPVHAATRTTVRDALSRRGIAGRDDCGR